MHRPRQAASPTPARPPVGPHPSGATLSVHRAFVVHLGEYGERRRRLHGWVEHLASGRMAQFSSLTGLLEFVDAFVAAESRARKGEGS